MKNRNKLAMRRLQKQNRNSRQILVIRVSLYFVLDWRLSDCQFHTPNSRWQCDIAFKLYSYSKSIIRLSQKILSFFKEIIDAHFLFHTISSNDVPIEQYGNKLASSKNVMGHLRTKFLLFIAAA